MINVNDFCNKCLEVEKKPTLYKLGKFMNSYSGKYLLCDCSGLIKGIIWGYPDNGKYGDVGIPDINANTMILRCDNVSTNFSNIEKGEVVHMNGHIGVYVGGGVVVESSPKWENGIQRTYCVGCGIPNKYGLNARTWTKHGKLRYIDYTNNTQVNNNEVYIYNGNSNSIVDALKSINVDSSYTNRKKIAQSNGITNYTGSSKQNIQLLDMLKKKTLKKP